MVGKPISISLAFLTIMFLQSVALMSSFVPLVYGSGSITLIIYSPILGIKTEPKSVPIPLTIINLLDEPQAISLNVSCPEGWSYSIVFGEYKEYSISTIFLREKESINLTLVLDPSPDIATGLYSFRVFGISAYSKQTVSNILAINIELVKPLANVQIEATVTEVSGSPGSTFSFRFNIKNNSYKDLTFKLNATIPEGWYYLGFKPSPYETKAISEITVRARSTYWGAVLEVWCPSGTSPGVYPIKIAVLEPAEGICEEVNFRAVVTGIPKVTLKTEGDLLSYSVEAGGTIEIPLVIENTGTTFLREINIYCSAPLGWESAILPSKMSLGVGEKYRAILYISPPAGAIAGDYAITIRAHSMEAWHEITLRITVTKTTYWGIIGIIVIVVAVFGLMFVFWRYGRL